MLRSKMVEWVNMNVNEDGDGDVGKNDNMNGMELNRMGNRS